MQKNDFQSTLDGEQIYTKNSDTRLIESSDTHLRVMSWNIERGYNLEVIIAHIRAVNPHVVCLQEVDWGNKRTGGGDVLQALAQSLNMVGAFVIEFYELDSPLRDARLAGGGVHGNAILTRIPFEYATRLEMPVMFDWEDATVRQKHGMDKEVRLGRRCAVAMTLHHQSRTVTICSAHLENVACGVGGRFAQLKSLVQQMPNDDRELVIAGDFNTHENWLSRLMGFGNPSNTIGKPFSISECRWWQEALLPTTGYADAFNCSDWTFKIGHWYKQKLDWILTKNSTLQVATLGDFYTSDHRSLWVDLG